MRLRISSLYQCLGIDSSADALRKFLHSGRTIFKLDQAYPNRQRQ